MTGPMTRSASSRVTTGAAEPLGLTLDARGANIAVWAEDAERIELCLFDATDRETERIALSGRTGAVHHAHIAGIVAGQRYGLRAYGRHAPAEGHRFNQAKLLVDPFATLLTGDPEIDPALHDSDPTDTAKLMPRAIATEALPPIDPAERPGTPWERTVIYEAHVRSLTRLWPGLDSAIAGTVEALATPEVIAHLKALGVTAIELLPIMAFADEPHLVARGLRNHWGYNSFAFLAPSPRYLGPNGLAGVRETVRRLHAAGIEVILDIALNHTAEGDGHGPTLSLRGLANRAVYARDAEAPDGYANETGCGHRLALEHPFVQRLAMDALRHWAGRIGVDGFRFDLAPALERSEDGFASGFFRTVLQDPALRGLKLIAEPWDVGPEGYRLGRFPAPMAEWNDRMRDSIRSFWRGDAGAGRALADGLLGSARIFDKAGRAPWASVNAVACHDGFTLADLTAYSAKHNQANGEDNRDGHDDNRSDNMGVEGPTDDPAITAARRARQRALVATALLAQGTPMLRAGDEIGQSQRGNNNAYCQDNAISWIDWASGDLGLLAFVRRVLALRAAEPALRQPVFLHGAEREWDGRSDVAWLGADGGAPDWTAPDALALVIRGTEAADPVALVLNAGPTPRDQRLAEEPGRLWVRVLDSAEPEAPPAPAGFRARVAPGSLSVFVAREAV